MTPLAWLSAALWLIILLLPWQPWRTRERFDVAAADTAKAALDDVTVLIPARNEADTIDTTLRALANQGDGLRIVVIDDQSDDGTADMVRGLELPGVSIRAGVAPPDEWSGKLWALQQGLADVHTPLVLLLDADIALTRGTLVALRRKLVDGEWDLVSLMAALRMVTFWERLLMPAFVYFFRLLYPFALANSRLRWPAAAAGGCILVRTDMLRSVDAFTSLRDALIDDCALARKVKARGGRTWIGLSHAARSHRGYRELAAIWNMVARTAFTQLGYSLGLLMLCTVLMAIAFVIPVAALLTGPAELAVLACAAMAISYLPTLRYYRQSPFWAATLPLIGTLYLAMTWTSAWRYWRGVRSNWKGRRYCRPAP